MRTTLEIPDTLLQQARTTDSARGVRLSELVSEALAEKLRRGMRPDRPWMNSFGKLRALRRETARISALIDAEFGHVQPED